MPDRNNSDFKVNCWRRSMRLMYRAATTVTNVGHSTCVSPDRRFGEAKRTIRRTKRQDRHLILLGVLEPPRAGLVPVGR